MPLSSPSSEAGWRRRAFHHGAVLFVGCILVAAIVQWFDGDQSLRGFLWTCAYSAVYTFCIGVPMTFIMPRAAPFFWGWPPWGKWPAFFGTMLLITAFGCLLAGGVFMMLGWVSLDHFWATYRYGMRIGVVVALIAGLASTVYDSLRARLERTSLELRTKELERQRALNAATAARLASLESRIHPHFLFNALNSISSLIPEDPQRAERLVVQMAELLRFSLDSGQLGLVPLAREIRIVEDYLEIEKARYGERLRYRLDVPPDLGEILVPPLSVQTLVENSVKHVVALRREGGAIHVEARFEESGLMIEVSDDGPGFRPDAVTAGHGIDNLDARLTALFQGEAKLNVGRREDRTVVGFTVPRAGAREIRRV